MKESYPKWKRILYRYGRIFIAGFLGTLAMQLLTGQGEDLTFVALKAMLVGAVSGGVAATGKSLRLISDKPIIQKYTL